MLGTFITWTDANTSTTLGYAGDLISDMTPLMIPVIAVGLGLLIFTVIVKTIQGRSS